MLAELNKSAARRYHFAPLNYAVGRHPVIPYAIGIDNNELIMVNNCHGHHVKYAWFNEDFHWALSHTLAHHWQVTLAHTHSFIETENHSFIETQNHSFIGLKIIHSLKLLYNSESLFYWQEVINSGYIVKVYCLDPNKNIASTLLAASMKSERWMRVGGMWTYADIQAARMRIKHAVDHTHKCNHDA